MNRPLTVALPVVLGVVLLAACDVVGGEWNTTIEDDGSGFTQIGIGYLLEEGDTVDCESEESTLDAGVSVEQRGAEVWCIYTFSFASLRELRAIYSEILPEMLHVHCLEIADERLLYDVEIVPTGDDSGDGEGTLYWRVTAPGEVASTNAGSREGESQVWALTSTSSTLRFRINAPEGEACPSSAVHLTLFVNDDGSGTATLRAPFIGDDELDPVLFSSLSDAGWSVEEQDAVVEGRRTWSSEDEFAAILESLPGIGGSPSELTLKMTEDDATLQRSFDLRGRLDFALWPDYWGAMLPDGGTPPFVLTYLPAGTTETVSGGWTAEGPLTLTRAADGELAIPLRAVSVLQPELEVEIDPDLTAELLGALGEQFLDEIPVGQVNQNPSLIQSALGVVFAPGKVNNMTNWTTFACGDYQTRVIKWLDAMRTHPDPLVRAQLAGLDYGPIQAYRGGHQAVVVFPRGTDWQETGTVFDPWPNQRPEIWTMQRWTDKFWWGVGVGEGGRDYPHMFGNPSHYSGTSIARERLHPRKIAVNSPVAVLVVAADGRRLGMTADGEFVNEIEGADLYPEPRGDGEYAWYFGLPQDEYEVQFTGTADGEMHVLVGDQDGRLVTYGPQPIERGGTAALSLNPDSIDEALELADRQVAPIAVTDDNVAELELGEPEAAEAAAPNDATRFIYLGVLGLCCLIPPSAVLVAYALKKPRAS